MRPTLLTLVTCLIGAASVGCGVLGPSREEFVIQIDSVGGPATVSGSAAFQQFFFGRLGPDGCYAFEAFEMTRSSTAADVTVMGQRVTGGLCTQSPASLNGEALTINPPVSDPFTLRVHQRDGTVLTRIIRVQ